LPLNPNNNKSKGFAFVQFEDTKHANTAIAKLNNSNFKGRNIILDSAV